MRKCVIITKKLQEITYHTGKPLKLGIQHFSTPQICYPALKVFTGGWWTVLTQGHS